MEKLVKSHLLVAALVSTAYVICRYLSGMPTESLGSIIAGVVGTVAVVLGIAVAFKGRLSLSAVSICTIQTFIIALAGAFDAVLHLPGWYRAIPMAAFVIAFMMTDAYARKRMIFKSSAQVPLFAEVILIISVVKENWSIAVGCGVSLLLIYSVAFKFPDFFEKQACHGLTVS